jgi:hypothetical protein
MAAGPPARIPRKKTTLSRKNEQFARMRARGYHKPHSADEVEGAEIRRKTLKYTP